MSRYLNLVSFDVPFPPNYGGVVDVFFKIKALNSVGVKVLLHCFEYGRGRQAELDKICHSVTYYKRDQKPSKLLSERPFIVATRNNRTLLQNLKSNAYPVLLEGLHCSKYLEDLPVDRKVYVRSHNIEHDYYQGLADVERRKFKKLFFRREAKKLAKYEAVYSKADMVFGISEKDAKYLSRYGNSSYLPAFHSSSEVSIREGRGDFCLYHGNLEVGENQEAALYLIEKVFSGIESKLVVAGNSPNQELKEACSKYDNVELHANIEYSKLQELIATAHLNVLPTFQSTGIKLKLLNALFGGRHAVVNTPMVKGTGLESLCTICDDPISFREEIQVLMQKNFSHEDIRIREEILEREFSNKKAAEKLIALIDF